MTNARSTWASQIHGVGQVDRVTDRPLVSVVIGSYNRRSFLERAIESVRMDGASLSHEMIVVDGGSTDGSLDWLVRQRDVISIIQHNRGEHRREPIKRRSWGYFMNLGFKVAQGRYILMISDDCLVVPGAISRGVDRFLDLEARGQRVGGVAFYYRNWPHERNYYVQRTFGGKLMVNHGLFARSALEAVGWIDEDRYQFYKADSDLCLKLWQAGFEVTDCPGAYIEHYEGANVAVRKENRATLARDREAYRQRWVGVFWDPNEPELRDRIEVRYDDPHRTAKRFPLERPGLSHRIRRRVRRTGKQALEWLYGLVQV